MTSTATSDKYAIHEAAREGRTTVFEQLLSANPKLASRQDEDERMPIHWAVSYNHMSIVQLLVQSNKFDPDVQDGMGCMYISIFHSFPPIILPFYSSMYSSSLFPFFSFSKIQSQFKKDNKSRSHKTNPHTNRDPPNDGHLNKRRRSRHNPPPLQIRKPQPPHQHRPNSPALRRLKNPPLRRPRPHRRGRNHKKKGQAPTTPHPPRRGRRFRAHD